MELKCVYINTTSDSVYTFNRTAYGIEIELLCIHAILWRTFNRTAYGIEISNFLIIFQVLSYLLIAPLMELKLLSMEYLNSTNSF